MDIRHKNYRYPTFTERLAEASAGRGPDDCWPWQGSRESTGYGCIYINYRRYRAHRISYERLVAPIPHGLTIDHDCHTRDLRCAGGDDCPHRPCVNPAHLKAVTSRHNILIGRSPSAANSAKTHCKKGHRYDTVWNSRDRRIRACRRCARDSTREYRIRVPYVPKAQKTPPYVQIAEHYRNEIRSGLLAPGAQLPSTSSMCEEWNVSHSTVTRSILALREGGWIFTSRGRLPVVAECPPTS